MNNLTLIISSVVVPFMTMACFGPWIRDGKWTQVASASAVIFGVMAYLLHNDGQYSLANSMVRALIISMIPIAGGWAFNRFVLSKQGKDFGG